MRLLHCPASSRLTPIPERGESLTRSRTSCLPSHLARRALPLPRDAVLRHPRAPSRKHGFPLPWERPLARDADLGPPEARNRAWAVPAGAGSPLPAPHSRRACRLCGGGRCRCCGAPHGRPARAPPSELPPGAVPRTREDLGPCASHLGVRRPPGPRLELAASRRPAPSPPQPAASSAAGEPRPAAPLARSPSAPPRATPLVPTIASSAPRPRPLATSLSPAPPIGSPPAPPSAAPRCGRSSAARRGGPSLVHARLRTANYAEARPWPPGGAWDRCLAPLPGRPPQKPPSLMSLLPREGAPAWDPAASAPRGAAGSPRPGPHRPCSLRARRRDAQGSGNREPPREGGGAGGPLQPGWQSW